MRTLLVKTFIIGGLLFNTSCGLIDGELLRPIGKIDSGSTSPDGNIVAPPAEVPADDGDSDGDGGSLLTTTKLNSYRPIWETNSVAVDSQGRKVYVGDFTKIAYHANGLVNLNENGSRNTNYNEGTGAYDSALRITSGAYQPDGNLIIAGRFTAFNGFTTNGIVRLKPDGMPDPSFAPTGTGFNSTYLWDMILQNDGKIVVTGNFTNYNGTLVGGIARLNTDGSLDTAFASNVGSGYVAANDLAIQTDGKILLGGAFDDFHGAANTRKIVRFNTNGTIDNTLNTGTGFNGSVAKILVLNSGQILVGGDFTDYNGTPVGSIVRLNSNGTLDTTFITPAFLNSEEIWEMAVQNDNKIIVGGTFTGTASNCLARLNEDGSHDATFDAGTTWDCDWAGDWISSINVRPNGQILVGGNKLTDFSYWNDGIGIFRLNADGSVDNSFQGSVTIGYEGVDEILDAPNGSLMVLGSFNWFGTKDVGNIYRETSTGTIDATFQTGTGFDNEVSNITILSDDSIIVGGGFTSYNGTPTRRIAKLLPDGTLDSSFNVGTGITAGGWPSDFAVQSDGKIIVAGWFTHYNGTPVNRIMRLNADGTLDPSFYVDMGTGVDNGINDIELLSDGSMILAGEFTTYNGNASGCLVKIDSSGKMDTAFSAGIGCNAETFAIEIQSDGKILAVGNFTKYQNIDYGKIIRLNPDGSPDTSFDVASGFGSGSTPYTLTLLANGKILVGGYFDEFNGVSSNGIVSLNSDGTVNSQFSSGLGFGLYGYVNSFLNISKDLVIAVGDFYTYQDEKSPYIALINTSDGSLHVQD